MPKRITMRQLEIRTENRYTLHPQNKKRCTKCEQIYEGVRENFNIHRKLDNDTYQYDGICKSCRVISRNDLSKRRKADIEWYCRIMIKNLKHRAKAIKIPFELTSDDLLGLWLLQKGCCFYTGKKMDLAAETENRKSPHMDFPSIDRTIPKNGYVKNNIVWCKWSVNRMKNNFSKVEFLDFCKEILEHHGYEILQRCRK